MQNKKPDADRAESMTVEQAVKNIRGACSEFRGTRRDWVLLDQSFEVLEERVALCGKYEAADVAAKELEAAKSTASKAELAVKALEEAKAAAKNGKNVEPAPEPAAPPAVAEAPAPAPS